MSLQARKELLFRMRSRYGNADRKAKSEILEGFIAATGYHRKYAVSVLSKPARDVGTERLFKERKRVYDEAVKQALVCI